MRLSLGILLVCVAVVGVAGYAVGAGSNSSDVTLCAAKSDGSLTLGAKGKCGKGDKKVTIAKEGPAGPKGDPGSKGDPGTKGDTGAPGLDANLALETVHYVAEPANDECVTKVATFCQSDGRAPGWGNFGNGYEKVGFYKDPDGIVHLVGAAYFTTSGGGGGGFVANGPFYLPPGFRPAAVEVSEIAVGNVGFSSEPNTTRVEIKPSGEVVIEAKTNRAYALSGITPFRTG